MESVFNLSNLIEFLHKTLVLTEDVKNVLRSNCDEALFCLKPWCMEVISQQEISRDACICYKAESEVEEIAAGISRALLHTQQLREQLSLNVVAEKKSNRFRMYEYSQASDSRQEVIVKTVRARSKNSRQDCDSIKATKQKLNLDIGFQNEVVKSEDVKSKETKNHNKQSVALPSMSRENKNFLAINRKSIKNMMRAKQHKDTYYALENKFKSCNSTMEPKCVKFVTRCTADATNELKHLIQKVSNESNGATTSKEYHMKCPLHGDSSPLCTYKHNLLSMNVVDSLRMTPIPGEIIKSLKVYHAYLNIEHSTKSVNKEQQKELNKFLAEFSKMDNVVQERITRKNCNMNILHKFVSLCHPLFSKHLNISKLIDIKAMYAELNPTCKVYGIGKLASGQILKSNETDCMTNGIWNDDHSSSLEGTSKVCCMRYKKKDQLLLFYDIMQKLLHTQYHIKLIKIIEEDLLPYMPKSFDYTQSEYVQIYKMFLILHQGLKSHVPVLVKTDK